MNARKRLAASLGLVLLALALFASAAQADFGIKSFSVAATDVEGNPVHQAGAHPYNYTVKFDLNQDGSGAPEGTLRDLFVELPQGLIGNPTTIPACPVSGFEGGTPACPVDTQVGVAYVKYLNGEFTGVFPLYNRQPSVGYPASLAFSLFSFNSFQEASLRGGSDFGINISDLTIPTNLGIVGVTEQIWGVPADPGHDPLRGPFAGEAESPPVPSEAPLTPFLTLPTSCGGPLKTTLRVDSLENPGALVSATAESLNSDEESVGLDGCNALEFNPTIESKATTNLADSPTGLNLKIHQPQPAVAQQTAGREYVCASGSWSGSPSEFAFQWLRNGAVISGATKSHYEVQDVDAGRSLQCEITATNSAGHGYSVSTPILIAPGPTPQPPQPGLPTIYVGSENAYCESGGKWVGAPSADYPFTYRWFRNGVLVPGADQERFEISSGEALQCEIFGTNAGGTVVAFSPTVATETPPAEMVPGSTERARVSLDMGGIPLSTASLKNVKVTLPEGMTLNASAANGLGACSEAQIGYQPSEGKSRFSEVPSSCPDASKLGTLEVDTPLLEERLEGKIYLAKPYENPFGNLTSIYLAIESPVRGITVKLAGKVTPDPTTGRLTATFTENPQLPIEDIETHFFNGPRAALVTPLTCGTKETTTTLVPWSTPEGADAHPADSFQTQVAAGGSGKCPSSEAQAANKPSFSAGTEAPQAGAYSPFLLKVTREDGTQRLSGIDTTLPKGVAAKFTGIPYCSEAQIAQAKSREAPNMGAIEQQSPSCPAASEVGSVTVGAGAGITPLYVGGHAYLAGPYKGAPLSLAIITPAVAGPFDLGAVVVRTALYIDPETAQGRAVSDPLPSIIAGVPLDLRSIAVRLDKPNFILNPTSCDPMSITGAAMALTGQSAALTSPFQVGGCSALKFKPNLKISLKGGTKRHRFPALKAVLTYPKGANANIASTQVTLPHSAFLEQAHIGTVCTRVQFAADACPKASIYGKAKAITPLLDQPLEGPVYLRSSSHELPDLVAALDGQIDVDLVGRVDTGKGGGIRNTFEAVPDAPVSKFVLEMKGGKKGLLVNSENICREPQRASVSFTGQNGKAFEATPLIANSCGGKAKKKHAKKGGSHGKKGGKGK